MQDKINGDSLKNSILKRVWTNNADIMYSPYRKRNPFKNVGEEGSGGTCPQHFR